MALWSPRRVPTSPAVAETRVGALGRGAAPEPTRMADLIAGDHRRRFRCLAPRALARWLEELPDNRAAAIALSERREPEALVGGGRDVPTNSSSAGEWGRSG
jgi:hypothetical protein